MTPKKIFYFASTHWDREWYNTFQGFRFRLVNTLNQIIDTLENNNDFAVFTLDGQSVVLDDYLEIRPEMRDRLDQLLQNKRLIAGPWYTMPDQFLTSGESLISNLTLGNEICKSHGASPMKVGYCCDVFGHIAQMPQILQGFGISSAVLGRGTNENTTAQFFSWHSPDGSAVNTFKLPESGGYATFFLDVILPYLTDKSKNKEALIERAYAYVDQESQRSNTPYIILMDGMDHEQIHPIAVEIVQKLQKKYNCPVVFDNLENIFQQVQLYENDFPIKYGELNETTQKLVEHNMLITNTLSSRTDIKLQNDKCQNLIEHALNPLLSFSNYYGLSIPTTYQKLCNQYLCQNHAHDSICGCSIDEVYNDMKFRYNQIEYITKAVTDSILNHTIHTEYQTNENDTININLYNSYPRRRHENVIVDITFPINYPYFYSDVGNHEKINSFKILDEDGKEIHYTLCKITNNTAPSLHYTSPLFKKGNTYTISFDADMRPMGITSYTVIPFKKPVRYLNKMTTKISECENEFIKIKINKDGTVDFYDKHENILYPNLFDFITEPEIGDGWFHNKSVNGTIGSSSENVIICQNYSGEDVTEFTIYKNLLLPATVENTIHGFMPSIHTEKIGITLTIRVYKKYNYIDCDLTVDNHAKDHMLRLCIPSQCYNNQYTVNQPFALIKRTVLANCDTSDWKEPFRPEKQFSDFIIKQNDSGHGLAFISKGGLHEVATHKNNDTLYITLLRCFSQTAGSDGQPDGQMQGKTSFAFRILPLDKYCKTDSIYRKTYSLQNPPIVFFSKSTPDKKFRESYLQIEGENVQFSTLKPSIYHSKSDILRVYNTSNTDTIISIEVFRPLKKAFLVDLEENIIQELSFEQQKISTPIKPWKIQTILLKYK